LMSMWMTLIGLINDISRVQSEREEETLDWVHVRKKIRTYYNINIKIRKQL
jgi:hypothetical protein